MQKETRSAVRHAIAVLFFCSALPFAVAVAGTSVIVTEARIDRFVDRVEALGTLRANESLTISSTITETITTLHFDDGDRVEAGQLLAEMNVAEERALLEEARVMVIEAERQYERLKSLQTQGQAAVSQLDERERERNAAQARVKAIEARISDRMLKAPFSGVLGLRRVSVGALVEPGDVITTLDDDRIMKLEFSVPSIYLSTLRPGLPVAATTQAFGDRAFHGKVVSIDSRIDPVTRSVLARAAIPNPERLLRPGLLMEVILSKSPRENVLLPEEALVPLGNKQYVLIVNEADNNRVVRREVRIGTRRPGQVEIVSGVAPGEKVITQGTTRVRPGDQVTISAVDDGSAPLSVLLESRAQ